MEDTKIVEDVLVFTILACLAAMCCQKEEEKQRKRRKIWTQKFLLHRNKYRAHMVTVNVFCENDPHSSRRYLQMTNDVDEVRMVTLSEYN